MAEKEPVVRLTIPIRRGIYLELKLLARKDRRSTSNLINKVLEDWIEGMKGGTSFVPPKSCFVCGKTMAECLGHTEGRGE